MWVARIAHPAWAIRPADLFELSSPPNPYVSPGHPDRFDTFGVSGQPSLSWLWVCWVRLGLSPVCEVEREEFQILSFLRVFEFILIYLIEILQKNACILNVF